MSYKAFGKLKEHCEIEALKEMSLTQINELLNGAHNKILSLEKKLRAARQNTKESPENSSLAPCNTGSPKISPELNMVLDMAQDGRIIAVSFDTEAAKALKALHEYRAKLRAGA